MTRPTLVWMQFGSCSGCTVSFLDGGTEATDILARYDVRHAPLLCDETALPERVDLAIVEGSVAVTKQHLKAVHDLRRRARVLVSLGACAENSGILHFAVGNQMPQPELDAFLPVHEIVSVDYVLPGCPPAPAAIVRFLAAFADGDTDYLAPYHDIIGKPEGRIRDIVQQGLCMSCGMCGATCPTHAISYVEGKPVIRDERCIVCGECYFQCPRAFLPCSPGDVSCDPQGLSPAGTYGDAILLRATAADVRRQAQAGGAVSALLMDALDAGAIDGALVAMDGPNPWEGVPTLVCRAEDVVASAGTKYAVCPILSQLRRALTDGGVRRLAVVGLPCQMEALEKLLAYPLGIRLPADAELVRIGLFCSSNFRYNAMHKMLEEEGGVRPADILRIDIGAGSFTITTVTGEQRTIPLSVVHGYEQESCKVCPDFTAEYTDLSVGAIGSPKGWSTVVVRTTRGAEFVRHALSSGKLEQHADAAPDMELVKGVAGKKRRHATDALAWRMKYGLLVPFGGVRTPDTGCASPQQE